MPGQKLRFISVFIAKNIEFIVKFHISIQVNVELDICQDTLRHRIKNLSFAEELFLELRIISEFTIYELQIHCKFRRYRINPRVNREAARACSVPRINHSQCFKFSSAASRNRYCVEGVIIVLVFIFQFTLINNKFNYLFNYLTKKMN